MANRKQTDQDKKSPTTGKPQRKTTSSQHGADDVNENQAPDMNQGEDSSEKLRRGALDPQYGTDSSSKTSEQTNRPQRSGSSSQGSTESSTGSDRDTMSGSRTKNR